MNQTRVQKLEQRILILQKVLLMYPSDRALKDMLSEAKKDYKLQMHQD